MTTGYEATTRATKQSLGSVQREAPQLMDTFSHLADLATAAGALDAKTKALITLGIAIQSKSAECVVYHVGNAARQGITRSEVLELLPISAYMGGGPALMAAEDALKHFDELHMEKSA